MFGIEKVFTRPIKVRSVGAWRGPNRGSALIRHSPCAAMGTVVAECSVGLSSSWRLTIALSTSCTFRNITQETWRDMVQRPVKDPVGSDRDPAGHDCCPPLLMVARPWPSIGTGSHRDQKVNGLVGPGGRAPQQLVSTRPAGGPSRASAIRSRDSDHALDSLYYFLHVPGYGFTPCSNSAAAVLTRRGSGAGYSPGATRAK